MSSTYRPGSSTIIWTSKTAFVQERRLLMTGIPKEMLGTKAPSITSRWMYSAPARATVLTWDPRLQKSAARIDGDNL